MKQTILLMSCLVLVISGFPQLRSALLRFNADTISMLMLPQQSGAQELNFGKNVPIPLSAIKTEAKAPITFNNEQELQLRLKSGGTVVIADSDLVTGEPNFEKRGIQFMALDTLELKNSARIVTGGNDLVIFANKIISEDGKILAFTDKTSKAAKATETGGAGSPGVSGGTVTIFAINGVEGRLHVDLSGQHGGDGAKGAQGSAGIAGAKGGNAQSSVTGCNHDGDNGTDGTPGGKGATGGPAGNGGHGGSFFLYNVGPQPIPVASWDFVAKPGLPGVAGVGGDGGPGGSGGEGGNGEGFCHGGHKGNDGGRGGQGESGPAGRMGAQGTSLVRNMNLELLIQTAKEVPLGQ